MHALETLDTLDDMSEIAPLFREYLGWAVPLFNAQNNLGEDIDAAVADAMGSLGSCVPPDGRTILARSPEGVANAVATFRRIRPDAAEIKRLYLRPEVRGEGLGRALVLRLIEEARARGYAALYLDTAAFMSSAQALYRSLGFHEIPEYPEADHPQDISPHVVYMMRNIG